MSDDVVIEVTMSRQSNDRLNRWAAIMHGGEAEPVAALLTDALATYGWVIGQQFTGHAVVALSESVIEHLAHDTTLADEHALRLVQYIPEGAEDAVRALLDEEAPS